MFGIGMQMGMGMSIGGFGGGILERAMMMAQGGMGISTSLQLPGLSLSASMGIGLGGDMTTLSSEAMMGGGSNFFHPLMGSGFGTPMAGYGSGMGMVPGMMPGLIGMQHGYRGQQNQQMMMMMMQLLMMMMQLMQQQMGQRGCSMPGQGMYGMGMPGQGMPGMGTLGQGMPGLGTLGQGMPGLGMTGMGGLGMVPGMGMSGMSGISGMNGMQGSGGAFDLQQGQTWTSPGGSTISWQGDTVTVNEPGGGTRQLGGAVAGAGAAATGSGAFAFAGAISGNGMSMSFAGAFAGVGGMAGVGAMAGIGTQSSGQPNNWKVWGDPHITDGSGKQQDFKTNNAMFTLQDGTKVAMCASGPQGVVSRVRIFPPNVGVNAQNLGGIDPKQTTVYHNVGNQKVAGGTLDQYAQYPGFGMSPFGNQMFGMF